jgi:hypothetical protein
MPLRNQPRAANVAIAALTLVAAAELEHLGVRWPSRLARPRTIETAGL